MMYVPTSLRATMLAVLATLTGTALCARAAEPPRGGVAEIAALPLDALLDLEVTGASRAAERMSEAAASVTVITADEIRALGYRTIADALRSVRGLSISSDRTAR